MPPTKRSTTSRLPSLPLWDNLAAAGLTVLAVSHRVVAFERADLVLRLAHGRRA